MKVGATENAKETVTSIEVLEQINLFRKQEGNRTILRHDTLLGIIRDEFEEEISLQKLLESNYISERGKTYPMFELTLSQAKQILVRESKFVRKAVISYISKLEQALIELKPKVPQSYAEALLEAGRLALKVEEQQKQLIEAQPKVEFFNAVADSKDAIPMNDVAKILAIKGYGRNNLFEFLRNKNVLMQNNRPFQRFIDSGHFRVIEQRYQKNNEECISFKTLVYQKGVDYIRKLIVKNETH